MAGFLDSVVLPDEQKVNTSVSSVIPKSGFLGKIQLPTPQDSKIFALRQREAVAKQKATEANSLSGLLKGTASEFGSRVAQIGKDVGSALLTQPAPKSLDMQESLKGGWDVLSTTLQETSKKFQDFSTAWTTPVGGVKKTVATGEVGMAVLNNLFALPSAFIKSAQGIPVVGYIADGVNNLFAALGAGGSGVADSAVDALPASQKTKETIRPLAKEIGALTAQIVGGKLGADGVVKVAEKSKKIMETLDTELQGARAYVEKGPVRQLPVSGETFAERVPISTPQQRYAEYLKSQGYEGYRPEADLPAIQLGAKPKETLPVIKAEAPKVKGEYTYEPIKGGFLDTVIKPEVPVAPESARTAPIVPKINEVPITTPEASKMAVSTGPKPLEPIGTGETKTSKLALGIEQNAIETGLVDKFSNLPEYQTVNLKQQAQFAVDLIKESVEKAMRVAMGEELPPRGILPEMVLDAVERVALKNGDIATLLQLSRSKLTSEATAMGQRIRALGERDQNSPVKIMQDVKTAREKSVENRTGEKIAQTKKKVIDDINAEMKKAVSKRPTWEDFVSEIKGNY